MSTSADAPLEAETRVPKITLPGRRLHAGGFRKALLGSRYIDPPIRIFAVLSVFAAFLPYSYESAEPAYTGFRIVSYALMLLAPFAPFIAAATSAVFFAVFMPAYPELLNPFQEPMIFATAVLLAHSRWLSWLLAAAALLALNGLSALVTPTVATPFASLLSFGLYACLVALAGVLLEHRIRIEVDRREQQAQAHERELMRSRVAFMADAHDTVSHGLATQAAMIRVLAQRTEGEEARRLVAELAVENGEVQVQLRELLAGLASIEQGSRSRPEPFADRVREYCERLAASAELGGYRISVRVGELPETLPGDLTSDVLFVLRELVTNMLKHASRPESCELSVAYDEQVAVLRVDSSNPAFEQPAAEPATIAARSSNRGGDCDARVFAGRYEVRVLLPVPSM